MRVRTSEDARALLRTAREVHIERHGAKTFTPGTHLPLEPAAQRLGIGPGSRRYDAAIVEVLEEDEGAIERDESARYHLGNTQYLITERGLEMLREGQETNPPGGGRGKGHGR